MSPLIRRAFTAAVSHPQQIAPALSNHEDISDETSDNASISSLTPVTVTGGAILVLDLDGKYSSQSSEDRDILTASTYPIVSHFTAHTTNVSTMSFSPSGLLLASADVNGQVIMVHSLVPSGALGPPRAIVKSKASSIHLPSPPQLLYKLVRGLSLARIVDIGFDDRQSVVYASSLNGTVHVFDLWQTTVGDSSGGGDGSRSLASSWSQSSRGNSYSDAGTSPAMDLAMLSHGGNGGHGSLPGHSYGTPQGTWGNMSSSQENSQFPVTNVSLFLQMTKPNTRVLQGYSDQRVSLPMRDTPMPTQHPKHHAPEDGQSSTNTLDANGSSAHSVGGEANIGIDTAGHLSLFNEVNIHSNCVIYTSVDVMEVANGSSSGSERNGATHSLLSGSYELLAGTSEGLLSRFRVVTKSAFNGSTVTPVVKELNRWDLCTLVSTPSTNGINSSDDDSSVAGTTSRSSFIGGTSSSLTAFLSLAGHSSVHAVDPPPLWMRPQVQLRHYSEPPSTARGAHATAALDQPNPPVNLEEESAFPTNDDHNGTYASTSSAASVGTGKKKKKNKESTSSTSQHYTSNGNISHEFSASATVSKQKDQSVDYTCASDTIRTFFPERVRAFPLATTASSYLYLKDARRYVSSHSRSSSIPINSSNGKHHHDFKSLIDPRIESAVSASLIESSFDGYRSDNTKGIAITRRAPTPEQLSAWEVEEDWTGEELASRVIDYDDEMFKDDDDHIDAVDDIEISIDQDERML